MGESSSTAKEELKEDDTTSMTSEISRMSFESARHNIDGSMSLHRKVIGYKIRTISGPIYENKLVKNLTMDICYEATNTNRNGIYILIKICLEGYNQYELSAYIDSSYFIYFEKRSLFSEFM